MQLVNTTTLSNIYPKDRTYNNRYKITIYTYLISQSGTGSSGVSNFQIIMHGEDTASSGYINWSGYVTTKLYVNGSLVKSVDCKTIKPTSEGGTDIMTYDFSITHSAGSGTASFTFNASSTTSSDGAVFMIGNWSIDAQTISSGSIVFPSLPDTYTVSYNSGIATSGSAPASQTKTYGVSLTLRTNTGSLAKANDTSTITTTFNGNGGSSTSKSSTKTTSYSFSKWNTQSNGNGTDYTSGGTYTGNGALTLYPKFTSSTSYGSITTPSSSRTGYTFNGWFTATSGGTKYGNSGESKTPTSSQTYYAQWTANTYTVTIHHRIYGSTADFATTTGSRTYVESYTPSYTTKTGYYGYSCTTISANTTDNSCICYYKPNPYSIKFNANGGSGYMANKSMTYDTADNLTSNAFTRTYYVTYNGNGGSSSSYSATVNYTFNKWFTNASGTGTSYSDGESVNNLTSVKDSTFNLYASWNSVATVLPTATRAGYTFSGWYNGSTRVGGSGDNFTPTSNVTLKAEWVGIPYTLQFNGNGATSGTMSDMAMVFGSYSQLTANDYAKTGSTFVGWNTQADGSGTSYKDGVSVINLMTPTATGQSTELYAQWESIIPISLHADSTNNVADGVAIGKKSEGGNKFEIGFDTEIGNSTTNFHLKLNGQDIGSGGGGNIDDVQVNGTSVVSNRVANITSIPASIVNGKVASASASDTSASCSGNSATATKATQDSDGNQINTTYFKKSGGTISGDTTVNGTATFTNGSVYVHTNGSSYNEGIRMFPSPNNWSTFMLLGADTTSNTGTSANSWGIFNNNGSFYITRNGASGGDAQIKCVNNVWSINGTVNTNISGNASTSTNATNDGNGLNIASNYQRLPSYVRSSQTFSEGWKRVALLKAMYYGGNFLVTYSSSYNSPHDFAGTFIVNIGYRTGNISVLSCQDIAQVSKVRLVQNDYGSYFLEFYLTGTAYNNSPTVRITYLDDPSATSSYVTMYDFVNSTSTSLVQKELYANMFSDMTFNTSGIWRYRVYSNGYKECWGYVTSSYQIASGYTDIGTGGGTYSKRSVAYPFTMGSNRYIYACCRDNQTGTFFAEVENDENTTNCVVTAVGTSAVTSVPMYVYAYSY